MKATFRKALTGAGAAILAGGVLIATGGTAFASLPPSLTTDSGATLGGIDFFNAAGVQITSGPLTAPMAAFAMAQTATPGVTKITEYAYTPVNGVVPGLWTGEQLSQARTFPVASPLDLHSVTLPVFTGNTVDKPLSTYITDVPNADTSTTDGYAGIYVIRLQNQNGDYAKSEILVNTTAGTWTQQNGAFPFDTTTTTVTPNLPSPQTPGTSVIFTATVADNTTPATIPAGTVAFFDGVTQIGTTQTLSGGTASVTTSTLSIGSHSITAVFTSSSPNTVVSSTSAVLPYAIQGPSDGSNTALSVNPTTGAAFTPVTLTATVTDTTTPVTIPAPGIPTGTVNFLDGTTPIGSAPLVSGVATFTDNAGFSFTAPGTGTPPSTPHSITAVFVPAAGETIAATTSMPVIYSATAPACPNGEAAALCTDPQNVVATVAAGTITITTPYTASNPLDLGSLVLNSSGTLLSASHAFGGTGTPGLNGSEIYVTDTRAGDPNWTASVQAGNFTSGGNTIDGQYSGLTGVTPQYVSGNVLSLANGNVHPTDNPAATTGVVPGGSLGLGGVKHTFATTSGGGNGSVGFTGTFTLNAPTSTAAGLYTGTVTFTVG
jgi:Bacterial Ig-like domain (group 3)